MTNIQQSTTEETEIVREMAGACAVARSLVGIVGAMLAGLFLSPFGSNYSSGNREFVPPRSRTVTTFGRHSSVRWPVVRRSRPPQ
jgi:hypothetical protein